MSVLLTLLAVLVVFIAQRPLTALHVLGEVAVHVGLAVKEVRYDKQRPKMTLRHQPVQPVLGAELESERAVDVAVVVLPAVFRVDVRAGALLPAVGLLGRRRGQRCCAGFPLIAFVCL